MIKKLTPNLSGENLCKLVRERKTHTSDSPISLIHKEIYLLTEEAKLGTQIRQIVSIILHNIVPTDITR